MIKQRLATQPSLYWLWEDNGPAALLRTSRLAGGISRIGAVYTPPAQRQRGYAGALVASAAGMLVAEGFDVFLFTDLANPTSNSLYQRIGFQRLEDFAYLKLLA
ncbi:GNAT family N-acetyltransferase [Parachitinimonas caeni]|uniref:GNAT family N-acetyltransferase n=1 Tax=Parachitinimonas caeni TaxID=3031301 RepID=UPI0027E4DB96|nr:GNAT family N-acetyltransferase [Parachitinimonas caeni]